MFNFALGLPQIAKIHNFIKVFAKPEKKLLNFQIEEVDRNLINNSGDYTLA